jgi:hypothetical protein
MFGDSRHAHILADRIRRQEGWDSGWHYTGLGQFGPCLSPLDALITALGNAGDPDALPVILEKAVLLEPEDAFSHYRAVAMATEAIHSPEAVPVLAGLLTAPGVRACPLDSFRTARRETVPGQDDVSTRNIALKELHLARALYCCGDADRLAEDTLRRYASGLQAHYARYAQEILADGARPGTALAARKR